MALTSAPGKERAMRGPHHIGQRPRSGGQGLPEEELSGGDEACLLGAHGVRLGPELRHPVGAHPEDQRGDPGCKYCKGYWRAGGGGTRLLQIRAGKAILQLVLDEPPDGLYNRWVKERLEYYRRVEPSAPLRDVSVVDQKVPRFRFSRTTQTGHVSDAIWEDSPELGGGGAQAH